MKAALALIAPLALSACATMPTGSPDGWAALGEAAVTGPITVKPTRVLEDSRCPMNARCITAGRVRVEATIWLGGRARQAVIASDEPLPIADGTLSIEAIEPESFMTNAHPRPADYRFKFAFSGGL